MTGYGRLPAESLAIPFGREYVGGYWCLRQICAYGRQPRPALRLPCKRNGARKHACRNLKTSTRTPWFTR